jgi:hypothetical protein
MFIQGEEIFYNTLKVADFEEGRATNIRFPEFEYEVNEFLTSRNPS